MNGIVLTGGQLKGFQINEKGEGMLSIFRTSFKNGQTKGTYIGVILSEQYLEEYQKNPISVGDGVNLIGGSVYIGSKKDQNGKLRPTIQIMNPQVEHAKGNGSGLYKLCLTDVRITEDFVERNNVTNAKAVYNLKVGDKDFPMWFYLSFWNDRTNRVKAMKLKKGSTIDISAQVDVDIFTNESTGKEYLNISLNVDDIAYTALPKKEHKPSESAKPQPEATPSKEEPSNTEESPSYEDIAKAQAAVPAELPEPPESDLDSDLETDENLFF